MITVLQSPLLEKLHINVRVYKNNVFFTKDCTVVSIEEVCVDIATFLRHTYGFPQEVFLNDYLACGWLPVVVRVSNGGDIYD